MSFFEMVNYDKIFILSSKILSLNARTLQTLDGFYKLRGQNMQESQSTLLLLVKIQNNYCFDLCVM